MFIGNWYRSIWPESAFPFFLTREADAMAQIADLLPKGTVLITGAVRAPDAAPGAKITRAYNSIYLIDHDGSFVINDANKLGADVESNMEVIDGLMYLLNQRKEELQ